MRRLWWLWIVAMAVAGCAGGSTCGNGGSVEVLCEEDGCFCGSGPREGEACEEEDCETTCLACADTGPLVLE